MSAKVVHSNRKFVSVFIAKLKARLAAKAADFISLHSCENIKIVFLTSTLPGEGENPRVGEEWDCESLESKEMMTLEAKILPR